MPTPIYTGAWGKCHIQGIAADPEHGYLYYSFTTKLIKARMDGTIVGSVEGLLGHLGCIAFHNGKIYGSLEYKNDSIGKGILKALGQDTALEDAFYVAVFDVDKIDRLDMDAEKDGIMTTVYLKEVVEDFMAPGHRYGCSGIDGTTFGPLPGSNDGKTYLAVAYGIYGDTSRNDNDHQILLFYDVEDWESYARPLRQTAMHKSGPEAPCAKYKVFTGNTTYGVQNLEYDAAENAYFMAVYPGKKPQYPNYYLFAVDASVPPKNGLLSLLKAGLHHEESDTYGWHFRQGSTGLYSFGNGEWLISENHVSEEGQCSLIYRYKYDEKHGFVLKI